MKNFKSVVCEVPDCYFTRLKESNLCEKHQYEAEKASAEADELKNYSQSYVKV